MSSSAVQRLTVKPHVTTYRNLRSIQCVNCDANIIHLVVDGEPGVKRGHAVATRAGHVHPLNDLRASMPEHIEIRWNI